MKSVVDAADAARPWRVAAGAQRRRPLPDHQPQQGHHPGRRATTSEPYARIAPDGTVLVNHNSPAFYLNTDRYGAVTVPKTANAKATPDWQRARQDRRLRVARPPHALHGDRRPDDRQGQVGEDQDLRLQDPDPDRRPAGPDPRDAVVGPAQGRRRAGRRDRGVRGPARAERGAVVVVGAAPARAAAATRTAAARARRRAPAAAAPHAAARPGEAPRPPDRRGRRAARRCCPRPRSRTRRWSRRARSAARSPRPRRARSSCASTSRSRATSARSASSTAAATASTTGHITHPGGTGAQLAVGLKSGLKDGTYTATYRVISADSHPVSGGFVFSIGRAGAAPAETVGDLLKGAQVGKVTEAAFGIARGADYLAIALVIGHVVVHLARVAARQRRARPAARGPGRVRAPRDRPALVRRADRRASRALAGLVLQGATAERHDVLVVAGPGTVARGPGHALRDRLGPAGPGLRARRRRSR